MLLQALEFAGLVLVASTPCWQAWLGFALCRAVWAYREEQLCECCDEDEYEDDGDDDGERMDPPVRHLRAV